MYVLPQPLDPRPGEALTGFVRRLAEINGMSLAQLIGIAGIGRIKAASDSAGWANLATASSAGIEKLRSMRWPTVDLPQAKGAVSFMGQPIRPSHLMRDRLRVCPECIRTGHTVREVWAVCYVTCCPIHRCMLVDTCDDCKRALRPLAGGHDYPWSCVCEKELAEQPIVPAPASAMDVTRILYPLIGHTEVTGYVSLARNDETGISPFDTLCLNDLLASIDLIGTVATTPIEEDPLAVHAFLPYGITGPARMGGDFVARGAAAIDVMRSWPDAWHDVLDDLAGRSPPGASSLEDRAVLATRMGRRCLAPDRGIDGVPLPLIAQETHRWLAERKGIVRRKRHRTSENARARILAKTMNASTVARELGIKQYIADFRRLYEETIDAMQEEGIAMPAQRMGDVLLTRVRERWEAHQRTVCCCPLKA